MSNTTDETRPAAPSPEEFLELLETTLERAMRLRRTLRMEDRIALDLGVDSLDALELLVTLEEHYQIRLVETPEVAGVVTIGDLHSLVGTLMQAVAR